MKKQIYLIIVIMLFSLTYVSADSFGIFKQNTDINLIFSCQNSTYLNISTIYTDPIGLMILSKETNTSKISNGVYNYTVKASNLTSNGDYSVFYHCDLNGLDTPSASTFTVNKSGFIVSTSDALIMLLGFAGIMILSFSFFMGGNLFQQLGVKIFLYGLSAITTVYGIGYGYSVSVVLTGEYSSLMNPIGGIYQALIYLLMGGGIGLILYLVYMAVMSWSKMRGLKE